jgi:phosphatidylglycerol:prolipoprotein diacylglycerol transferase
VFSTLIQIGPFHLPTYATLLALGIFGGVLLSAQQGQRQGLSPTHCFDAALLGASGALVGARMAYVALNWAYYGHHLSEALRLWAGGLAWQGGLIVGLPLVALYAVRHRLPPGALLDVLASGTAWLVLFLWLGSGAANDVYGRETFPTAGLSWALSGDLPDLYGLRAPRINVPLLGALWSGLVLIGVWAFRKRSAPPGALFLACLGLTGLGSLLLVPLQANPAPFLFRVRLDGWFNLALTIGGLGGLLFLKTAHRSRLKIRVHLR